MIKKIKDWYQNFIKREYHKIISSKRPKYSLCGHEQIYYADINKLISPTNPCCVGDIVITEHGWDCGFVAKVNLQGMPTLIYAGCDKYNTGKPHLYGGIEFLDWYKTSYKMFYSEWCQLVGEEYYAFRRQVRQKEVVENKHQCYSR